MKEPKKIPLDPETPQAASVEKIPMPSIYPEPMRDDVVESTEQAFGNFIQKAKESKKKYDLWVQNQNKEPKDST